MRANFALIVFIAALEEVFARLDGSFEEAKRVQGTGRKTDPKNWKCGDFLKRELCALNVS